MRLEVISFRMVVSPRGYRLETAEGKIMKTKLILATLLLACTAAASSSEPETPMCLCKFVAPRYPPIARQAVIQGNVHVQVDVGSNGVPGDIDILDQAHRILGESAVTALKNWRFCSPSGNTEPHKVTVTFIFKLEGEPTQSWVRRTLVLSNRRPSSLARPLEPQSNPTFQVLPIDAGQDP